MILVVKAEDLKVGMECVGPVLFGDYGIVTELTQEDQQVLIVLDDAPPISRHMTYEFEVLIEA